MIYNVSTKCEGYDPIPRAITIKTRDHTGSEKYLSATGEME